MDRKVVLACAGAFALAVVVASGAAMAAAIPSTTVQLCSDQTQNNTLKYINSVQKQIRLSIKNNLKGKDSKCSGGFACAGGPNHNKTCNPLTNGEDYCGGGTDSPNSQCTVNVSKGIAGAINKAKASLRAKIDQFCTAGDLATLGFPNSRCPDATTESTLADCILQGAIGDFANGVFGDAAGEVMGRAAGDLVPQPGSGAGDPIEVCGVTLASVLGIGSESSDNTPAEAGGGQPANITGCVGTACTTTGQGAIGNNLTSPTQTFAGLIPICLVTVTGNAGNGTPQSGTIDLGTGEQHSFAPISSTVLIGTVCPICDAATGTCTHGPSSMDGGPNNGGLCNNKGATDIACPPTISGSPPIIPNPLDLDTESNTLSVPANNPGAGSNNPSGTFCGACDLDDTIGCNNDSVCVTAGVCSGAVGSGCCVFGTNTGAFGNDSATSASANGVRGPYVPKLATIFCTGKSGSALVDGSQGLPGPVRLVQQQLNAFQY